MADGARELELANLVCRFGDKVLLDHFDEIFLPAFDEGRIRTYGASRYFFADTGLVHLGEGSKGEPVIGLAGRFIKDGQLRREQIYVDGGLVKDRQSMQSSPSAIFLLILNNHRLVYVRETAGAPDKAAFRSTLLAFLKQVRSHVVKTQFKAIDEEFEGRLKRREEKDKVLEAYEPPTLQLIPLTSRGTVAQFVKKYEVLKRIKITYRQTNDENPLNDFFAQLKESKEALGANSASVIQESKDGLNKDEAITQITAATDQGINTVVLRGTDEGGDTLIGNNDSFQIKKPIADLDADPEKAAAQLFESFNELVTDGLVKVEATGIRAVKAIRRIFGAHFE